MRILSRTKTPRTSLVLEKVASRFRVLAEVQRLQILQSLMQGEKSVTEITLSTGSSQSNISKHLKILLDCGILDRRQVKNTVYYRITDPSVFKLCDLVCTQLEQHHKIQIRSLKSR